MLRTCLYLLMLLALIAAGSCTRKVCPAYASSFLPSIEQQDSAFSYFIKDTIPREDGLYASTERYWYGITKPRHPIFKKIFGVDYPSPRFNYPGVIPELLIIMPDTLLQDSAVVEEVGLDSLLAEGADLISDSLSVSQKGSAADTTAKAPTDREIIDDPRLPPPNVEQMYYEQRFKEELLKFLQSGEKLQEKLDSLQQVKDEADSLQENKKKFWQFSKNNKSKDAAKDSAKQAAPVENSPEKGGSQKKGILGRLKQKKKNKKSGTNKKKEEGNKEEEEEDDW